MLSRTELLAITGDHKDIEIQGRGTVRIKQMNGVERDRFEQLCSQVVKGGSMEAVRARLVCACLVDDSGSRIFTDDDIPLVNSTMSGAVLQRIFDACTAFNAITDSDVDELAKN